MNIFSLRYFLLLITTCFMGIHLTTATHAATETLDTLAAIVDNQAILTSDLNNRIQLIENQLQKQSRALPPQDLLRKQMLERLIIESIQLQLAEHSGIRVSDNELNEMMQKIAEQNHLSVPEFQKKLTQENISYADFRQQLYIDRLLSQVQQRYVGSRVQVTDQDVQHFLHSPIAQQSLDVEYHLHHILVPISSAPTQEEVQKAQDLANHLIQQSKEKNTPFESLALTYSAGQTALEGGDLGWRKAGQLPTLFSDSVTHMKVGEISNPIRSASGFHIIRLTEKRGDIQKVITQTLVKHILIKPTEVRSDTAAKLLIDDLYQQIKNGADFSALAKTYSDDPGSARSGGELGWVSPGQMVPEFETAMDATATNKITTPFRSSFGWHILTVTNRRQQDMSEVFRVNQAKNAIYKRKYEEELELWLKEIRQAAFVEIKTPPT